MTLIPVDIRGKYSANIYLMVWLCTAVDIAVLKMAKSFLAGQSSFTMYTVCMKIVSQFFYSRL